MQICPFCGQNYRVEMTRVEGPWAFFECAGCLELTVVRGKGGFELPKLPRVRPPARQAQQLPAPTSLGEGSSEVPISSPIQIRASQTDAATAPAMDDLKQAAIKAVQTIAKSAFRVKSEKDVAKPVLPGKLRSLAISGSSLAMNALCGILIVMSLTLPFLFSPIRQMLRGELVRAPASASLVTQNETLALTPAAVPIIFPKIAPPPDLFATVTAERAVLREGPSLTSARISSAIKGLRLKVLNNQDGWTQVAASNPAGSAWIRADLVSIDGARP